MSSKRYAIVPHQDQKRFPGYVVAREILTEEPEEPKPETLAWLDEQREEERLAARGIDARLARLVQSARETPAMQAVRAFVAGPKLFLIIGGSVGTGKTVAAAAAIAGHGESAALVKSLELAKHGLYGEDNDAFWDRLASRHLLAIDDLGTEPRDEKGYTASLFESLMDRRYETERKTIITTNVTGDQFKAIYCGGANGRVFDRMKERGEFLKVGGESMRRPA